MSNKSNDGGNGFKNSRIDLSQLGNDNWSKSFTGRSPAPGMPKSRSATVPGERNRAAKLEDLFENRVHAAIAERSVKQNRRQGRIWFFAGGLFLASLGGIAAAYYLVGPVASGGDKLQRSSLLVENQEISRIQSVTVVSNVSTSAPVESGEQTHSSDAPILATPPSGIQTTDRIVLQETARVIGAARNVEAASVASPQQVSEADQYIEPVTEKTPDGSSEPKTVSQVSERMVRIVPTAVSGESETKTNVVVSKVPTVGRKTIGQWLAVPEENGLDTLSLSTAATSQQATMAKPADPPVKTQQELFKLFQAYLEREGYAETIDHPGQKALFNKFIRWSVEAPTGN